MKFSEVIAELEKGSKDTYTAKVGNIVYECHCSDNGYFYVYQFINKKMLSDCSAGGGFNGNIRNNMVWTKKVTRREITAAEAVQAILDGKTVFTTHPLFHDAEVNKDNLESINWTERLFYKGKWFIED